MAVGGERNQWRDEGAGDAAAVAPRRTSPVKMEMGREREREKEKKPGEVVKAEEGDWEKW